MGKLFEFKSEGIFSFGVWWENCVETEVKKLVVKICPRNVRGGSAASARRLTPGLVRKAPSGSRKEVFWMRY